MINFYALEIAKRRLYKNIPCWKCKNWDEKYCKCGTESPEGVPVFTPCIQKLKEMRAIYGKCIHYKLSDVFEKSELFNRKIEKHNKFIFVAVILSLLSVVIFFMCISIP